MTGKKDHDEDPRRPRGGIIGTAAGSVFPRVSSPRMPPGIPYVVEKPEADRVADVSARPEYAVVARTLSTTAKWPVALLGDVVNVDRSVVQPEGIEAGTLYVGLEHITGEGSFEGVVTVQNGELASAKFAFKPGQVLFGKLRPYLRKIARPSFSGICSTDILPLLPGPKVDADYLYHYLRTPQMVELATARSSGANLPRLSPGVLKEFPIPLPPLPEQQRIAAILDKADALRRKRREAIVKLDTLLQSVFLEMFGDPVTNPRDWPVGSIDIVVDNKSDLRCGPFGTQLKVEELVPSGIPLLGIENVHNCRFSSRYGKFLTPAKAVQLRAFDVRPGDVLVTRMGTIGRACVVPDTVQDARISYHLFRVRPSLRKCIPEFLASTIARSGTFQRQLKQLAHGAIMAGLNTSDLRRVKFLLPPVDRQRAYVDATHAIEIQIAAAMRSLSSLEALFESLQHRAFTGEQGYSSPSGDPE
jgi:type I restriction enzyme, S subunit